MFKSDKQEFEELSIGTVTGLQAFLRNAQSQYNLGLEKESELVGQGDHEFGDLLHNAFLKLRGTTNHLIAKLQTGEEVSQLNSEALQHQYDDLINLVSQTRKVKPPPEKKLEVFPEKKPKEVIPVKKIEVTPKPIEKKPEPEKTKPKTGTLNIKSDDAEVIDVKERVSVDEQSKLAQTEPVSAAREKKKRRQKKKKSNEEASGEGKRKENILLVVKKSREQYDELKKKYARPNIVQQMLFEEVQEGIEQLEILAKKPLVSKEKQGSVAELASHTKHALQAIVEAAEVEVDEEKWSTGVPIVTEQASESASGVKKPDQMVSFVPTSVTAKKPSITKRPVPKQLQTLPKPASIYEAESLTKRYLTAPKYQHFIAQNFSSPAGFERLLDATITQIEADTIDQIEKWLGDLPASAFSFIKDMTISELATFANRSHENVTTDLQRENIKYETFVEWRDLVDEMLQTVRRGEKMKYGELFAHWMIEMAMQDSE